VYQNKELAFYLWIANILILQGLYSDLAPWLGTEPPLGAPLLSKA
jgi:hypothetical protein